MADAWTSNDVAQVVRDIVRDLSQHNDTYGVPVCTLADVSAHFMKRERVSLASVCHDFLSLSVEEVLQQSSLFHMISGGSTKSTFLSLAAPVFSPSAPVVSPAAQSKTAVTKSTGGSTGKTFSLLHPSTAVHLKAIETAVGATHSAFQLCNAGLDEGKEIVARAPLLVAVQCKGPTNSGVASVSDRLYWDSNVPSLVVSAAPAYNPRLALVSASLMAPSKVKRSLITVACVVDVPLSDSLVSVVGLPHALRRSPAGGQFAKDLATDRSGNPAYQTSLNPVFANCLPLHAITTSPLDAVEIVILSSASVLTSRIAEIEKHNSSTKDGCRVVGLPLRILWRIVTPREIALLCGVDLKSSTPNNCPIAFAVCDILRRGKPPTLSAFLDTLYQKVLGKPYADPTAAKDNSDKTAPTSPVAAGGVTPSLSSPQAAPVDTGVTSPSQEDTQRDSEQVEPTSSGGDEKKVEGDPTLPSPLGSEDPLPSPTGEAAPGNNFAPDESSPTASPSNREASSPRPPVEYAAPAPRLQCSALEHLLHARTFVIRTYLSDRAAAALPSTITAPFDGMTRERFAAAAPLRHNLNRRFRTRLLYVDAGNLGLDVNSAVAIATVACGVFSRSPIDVRDRKAFVLSKLLCLNMGSKWASCSDSIREAATPLFHNFVAACKGCHTTSSHLVVNVDDVTSIPALTTGADMFVFPPVFPLPPRLPPCISNHKEVLRAIVQAVPWRSIWVGRHSRRLGAPTEQPPLELETIDPEYYLMLKS